MTDDFANELPRQPIVGKIVMGVLLFFGALAVAAFLIPGAPPAPQADPSVGRPLPELQVEGWLNGPGPTSAELKGKVCVVEAWAFWCGPCLQAAPHIVGLYQKYHPQGVVFLGLTHEGQAKLKESQQFLEKGKITWPCGYGAMATIQPLVDQSLAIPWIWVVNQQGIVVWAGDPQDLPEKLLDDLLK